MRGVGPRTEPRSRLEQPGDRYQRRRCGPQAGNSADESPFCRHSVDDQKMCQLNLRRPLEWRMTINSELPRVCLIDIVPHHARLIPKHPDCCQRRNKIQVVPVACEICRGTFEFGQSGSGKLRMPLTKNLHSGHDFRSLCRRLRKQRQKRVSWNPEGIRSCFDRACGRPSRQLRFGNRLAYSVPL